MNLQFLNLSGPWALALLATLVALLVLACLRALRRRREVVPALTVFARVRAQNLPPAPPPRWLDRAFWLRVGLLALLVLILAGLAIARPQARPRQVAVLIDDGPTGQFRLDNGETLAAAVQATVAQVQADPTLAGAQIHLLRWSQLHPAATGNPTPVLTGAAAVQTIRARPPQTDPATQMPSGWDAIHVISPQPPPAAVPGEATTESQVVWHRPAAHWQRNYGIVRVWIEPVLGATAPTTVEPANRWELWADVAAQAPAAEPAGADRPALIWEQSTDGLRFEPLADIAPSPVPPGGGVLGPVPVPAAATPWLRARLIQPANPAAATDFPDALAADNQVRLLHSADGTVSARLAGDVDTPMLRAALATWQIAILATDDDTPATLRTPQLMISDGSPAAEARLAQLRRQHAPVLPVYVNPQFDVPGLHLSGAADGAAAPRAAATTHVPAGLSRYDLLGRQSWQIAAVRPAAWPFGGTVVVDSPAGPVVARWLDGRGRPAWGLLFNPVQSSLANRHSGAWLALWDLLQTEAADQAGTVAGHGGWQWQDSQLQPPNLLDRTVTLLPPGGGGAVVLEPGRTPAGDANAAGDQWAMTSLAGAAAVLALLLMVLLIRTESFRSAPTTGGNHR